VVFALGSHLVDKPTEFVRFTVGILSDPGEFSYTRPLTIQPKAPHYAGKVVVLVDEITQSQAEYTAMAFRAAPETIVVGSKTAGADGNVSRIPLPGGLHTMISGIGVFYPDKRPTQCIGILPDVEAKATIAGIRSGRDEVLEEGLRQILGAQIPTEDIIRMTVVQ
jgi:C-terminal processing protease CtpA/Prc